MKLVTQEFPFSDYTIFKTKMLNWAKQFNIFCLLDNNGYDEANASFNCILAADSKRSIDLTPEGGLQQLQRFYDEDPCWLFGHLGYNLNSTSPAKHLKSDAIGFGAGFFFEPAFILRVDAATVTVYAGTNESAAMVFAEISATTDRPAKEASNINRVNSAITRQQYVDTVEQLRQHIRRGDCYEINFCQQFFADNSAIDPLEIYLRLVQSSPNPFGAFYKLGTKYCLCASPERYLKKTGQAIISQPIKGTSSRNPDDAVIDEHNRLYLTTSEKERSENVMIVDLVRNDLSKICEEGSVFVKELFGVYSFPQVHQMISTVQGWLRDDVRFTDAISATFPMGSMTGAPKHRVMQLIDEYEASARGLFSGSLGYITPNGDFDFNVVIRSIFYNANKKYISFSAGSGITFYSDAAAEYNECLLKANAIREILAEGN